MSIRYLVALVWLIVQKQTMCSMRSQPSGMTRNARTNTAAVVGNTAKKHSADKTPSREPNGCLITDKKLAVAKATRRGLTRLSNTLQQVAERITRMASNFTQTNELTHTHRRRVDNTQTRTVCSKQNITLKMSKRCRTQVLAGWLVQPNKEHRNGC